VTCAESCAARFWQPHLAESHPQWAFSTTFKPAALDQGIDAGCQHEIGRLKDGFLGRMGVIDFAGGLVVHLSAGIGGLVAAKVIGRRQGYGSENPSPFDLSLAVMGTGLLWVGWFGFNGESALAANSHAVMAIIATHLAACAGAIT
jgi:ammonia channel protein AmtB